MHQNSPVQYVQYILYCVVHTHEGVTPCHGLYILKYIGSLYES